MADDPGLLTNLPAQVSSFIGREATLPRARTLATAASSEPAWSLG
jgi:hypothetical protein